LEYANKAKSIQNKPQLGSTLSKDILLKDLVVELAKAKADLTATKSKDGVYMDNSNYEEIMNDIQEYKTEIQENVRKQEQLKKQNDFLKNKLATVEVQNLEFLTMINTLSSTVDTLHNKIDTQKQNEKNLITSSSKFKDIINNISSNLNAFHHYEAETKGKVKNLVETTLKPTIVEILRTLNSKSNLTIEKEVGDIGKDFDTVVQSYQTLVSDACKNVSDSILSKLPTLFEDVENRLKSMDNIDIFVSNLSEQYTKLSQENNHLKTMLNENLFNNHQEIVQNAVGHTYNQLQEEQQATYSKVLELLNSSSVKQQELVSKQIRATVTDVIGVERSNLNPIKDKWNESTRSILNSLDSESIKFTSKHQSELSGIFSKLKESNNFASNSKVIIDKELDNVINLSKKINDTVKYRDVLNLVEKKFDSSTQQNNQFSNMLQSAKVQIESSKDMLTKEIIDNSSKTNHATSDIEHLINEIETEQSEIKRSLLPTGKTPQRKIFNLSSDFTQALNNNHTDSYLNRSPPKFQLIGQRFDFTQDDDDETNDDKENNPINLPMKRKNGETPNRPRKAPRPMMNSRTTRIPKR
jgi:kinesin family protein 11